MSHARRLQFQQHLVARQKPIPEHRPRSHLCCCRGDAQCAVGRVPGRSRPARLGGHTHHVQIGKGAADEVKSDLATVEAKFTALTAELRGEFKAQTDAVKSALDAMTTAVSDLSAHPSAKAVTGVVTAASGVAAAVSSLLAALVPDCGSGSDARRMPTGLSGPA